ncbi:MAG TPA: universal stress protein [Candidatus Hypogeohydataceae bacterium YC41]
MNGYKKILCPVDYSVCSNEALKQAVSLATAYNAKLYLLHVVDVRMYGHEAPLSFEMPKPDQESIEKVKKDLADSVLKEAKGKLDVETIVTMGIPAVEIINAARQKGIDLIVMGTHGRTGIAHVVIGSVAENVVRKAPCPVLTVRHP